MPPGPDILSTGEGIPGGPSKKNLFCQRALFSLTNKNPVLGEGGPRQGSNYLFWQQLIHHIWWALPGPLGPPKQSYTGVQNCPYQYFCQWADGPVLAHLARSILPNLRGNEPAGDYLPGAG